MKRTILLCISILWVVTCFAANDIVRVSATYEYVSNDPNETPNQAEKTALQRARQKALEDKFGTDVSAVTSTLISSSGETSHSNVFSLGETSVRGEWIETIKEEVLSKSYTDGFWIVKVHVEGKARNNAVEKADIRYALVKDIQDVESPVSFRDGNNIFLRFTSPVSGHLCVYLVDETQNAYCLIPYANQPNGNQVIEANKDYIFFSPEHDKNTNDYCYLTCEKSSEQNALYVIFSPNDFTKASDQQTGTNFRGDRLPRELSYEQLLKWLSRVQTKDPQLLVRTSVISIRK